MGIADAQMFLSLRSFLVDFVGNSLLPRAGLGIRKVQTKGENLEALQAKFDDIGRETDVKLVEAAIVNFRSKVKINRRQSALPLLISMVLSRSGGLSS